MRGKKSQDTIIIDQSNHRIEHLLSQPIIFCPWPPSLCPGWNPPDCRGGFCASSLFSILTLMSRARVKKASSTLMLALADVSINLIPYSIASCSPLSLDTKKWQEMKAIMFYARQCSYRGMWGDKIEVLGDAQFTLTTARRLTFEFWLIFTQCWLRGQSRVLWGGKQLDHIQVSYSNT